jgi:hypothetical protein
VIPMFCEHTKGSTQTTPLDVWPGPDNHSEGQLQAEQ